jgi:hypothetical protein
MLPMGCGYSGVGSERASGRVESLRTGPRSPVSSRTRPFSLRPSSSTTTRPGGTVGDSPKQRVSGGGTAAPGASAAPGSADRSASSRWRTRCGTASFHRTGVGSMRVDRRRGQPNCTAVVERSAACSRRAAAVPEFWTRPLKGANEQSTTSGPSMLFIGAAFIFGCTVRAPHSTQSS